MAESRILQAPTESQILQIFSRHGYTANSLINQSKLEALLKVQHQRIVGTPLNKQLFSQIWEQVQTNSRGQTTIQAVVSVIKQAEGMLRYRISQLSREDGMIDQTDEKIRQKKQQISEYKQFYSDQPAKINSLTKQLINFQLLRKQQDHELSSFANDHYSICKLFGPQIKPYNTYRKQATFYERKTEKPDYKSKKFLFVFHLTWILILLELFLCNIRLSLAPLCVYLWSFYLIMFETQENFIKFTNEQEINKGGPIGYWIIGAILSIIFDFIFIIMKFSNKVLVMPYLHQSNAIYYWVLLFILIISIFLRIITIFLYIQIRSKCGTHYQYFQIFKLRIYLLKKETMLNKTLHKTQYVQQ